MTRRSTSYRPANAWVISVQLDQESHEKLKALCGATGFAMSRMIKTLILGARIQHKQRLLDDVQVARKQAAE